MVLLSQDPTVCQTLNRTNHTPTVPQPHTPKGHRSRTRQDHKSRGRYLLIFHP